MMLRNLNLMEKDRTIWIDSAKGIGILAIMLGHIQYINWMTPFKIVIFFVVSGYLYAQKQEGLTARKALSLTKKLLIPYFTFGLIFLLIELMVSVVQRKPILDSFKALLSMVFSMRGLSTLWFLPTLLGGTLLALQIRKYKAITQIGWASIVILLSSIYSSQQGEGDYIAHSFGGYVLLTLLKMCAASIFILGGGYVQNTGLLRKTSRRETYLRNSMAVCVLILSVLCSQFYYGSDFNNLFLSRLPLVYFCTAFLQSLAIMILVNDTPIGNSKVLSFFGKNSLFFMITHHGFKFCRIITTVTKMFLPSGSIKVFVDFSILLVIESILFFLWQFVKRKAIRSSR